MLSRWVLRLLTIIAEKYGSIKVTNSAQLTRKLSSMNGIKDGHKLSTMDYTSMFTNIPYYVPREIISDDFYLIKGMTSAPLHVFLAVLDFIIDSSSYFTSGSAIYKQRKGLNMGNELSQVLADIATNKATIMTIASINQRHITFVFKYVDDFFTAMGDAGTRLFQQRMSKAIQGLSLEVTFESETNEVIYLDVKFKSNDDGSLTHLWWQKDCAKGTILNYFSNHRKWMKMNVVREYMRHAFCITSPPLYSPTAKKLTKVLRKSSYPTSLIRSTNWSILNEIGNVHTTSLIGSPDAAFDMEREINVRNFGTEALPRHVKTVHNKVNNSGDARRYISVPFYDQSTHGKIQSFISSNRVPVKLAPSSVCKNNDSIFSVMTAATIDDVRSSQFSLYCARLVENAWLSLQKT